MVNMNTNRRTPLEGTTVSNAPHVPEEIRAEYGSNCDMPSLLPLGANFGLRGCLRVTAPKESPVLQSPQTCSLHTPCRLAIPRPIPSATCRVLTGQAAGSGKASMLTIIPPCMEGVGIWMDKSAPVITTGQPCPAEAASGNNPSAARSTTTLDCMLGLSCPVCT